jgi:hypothetical protein
LEDTWGRREMPVLGAVVALLEQSYMVTVSDIAARTGLELAEVARSLDAMDPTYVDFRKTETGGDPTFWYVLKVTPEARQVVGQWPTADGLIDRLAKALRDAAEAEDDPERHYQLRQASGLLGDSVRDVAVQIAATFTGAAPRSAAGPSAGNPGAGASSAGTPGAGASSAGASGAGKHSAAPPADAG